MLLLIKIFLLSKLTNSLQTKSLSVKEHLSSMIIWRSLSLEVFDEISLDIFYELGLFFKEEKYSHALIQTIGNDFY